MDFIKTKKFSELEMLIALLIVAFCCVAIVTSSDKRSAKVYEENKIEQITTPKSITPRMLEFQKKRLELMRQYNKKLEENTKKIFALYEEPNNK